MRKKKWFYASQILNTNYWRGRKHVNLSVTQGATHAVRKVELFTRWSQSKLDSGFIDA